MDKSDAPKDNVEFDLPQFNPIEEAVEPVHTGKDCIVQMIALKIAKISPALWVQRKLKPMKPEVITEAEEHTENPGFSSR